MKYIVALTAAVVLFFIGFASVSWAEETASAQGSPCVLDGEYVVSGTVAVPEDPAKQKKFKGTMLFYGCPAGAPMVYLDLDFASPGIAGIFGVSAGWFPYAVAPDGRLDIALHSGHLQGDVGLTAPGGSVAHSFTLLADTPGEGFKLEAHATRRRMSPELRGPKGERGAPGLPGKDGPGNGTRFLCLVPPDFKVKWGGLGGALCAKNDFVIEVVIVQDVPQER